MVKVGKDELVELLDEEEVFTTKRRGEKGKPAKPSGKGFDTPPPLPTPPPDTTKPTYKEPISERQITLSLLQEQLKFFTKNLNSIDESDREPTINIYTSWIQKALEQGFVDFDHTKDTHEITLDKKANVKRILTHNISNIGVFIPPAPSEKLPHVSLFESLEHHRDTWKQMKEIEGKNFSVPKILAAITGFPSSPTSEVE